MKIIINGQSKNFNGPTQLNDVIAQFCKDASRVIAELNGDIIKKPSWNATTVKDGDMVELVSFVGGG